MVWSQFCECFLALMSLPPLVCGIVCIYKMPLATWGDLHLKSRGGGGVDMEKPLVAERTQCTQGKGGLNAWSLEYGLYQAI